MDMTLEEMQATLNVNILLYNYATQLSIQSMMKHNFDDGQILFIHSVLAHTYLCAQPQDWFLFSYQTCTQLLDGWRKELNFLGRNIRTGQISPGVINMERSL